MDLDKAKKIGFTVEEIKKVNLKLITIKSLKPEITEVKFCYREKPVLGSESVTAYMATDALVDYYITLLEEYKSLLEKEISEM